MFGRYFPLFLVIFSRVYSVFSLFILVLILSARYLFSCLFCVLVISSLFFVCVLVIHYISSLFISCASRNLVINNEAFNVVHGCLMSFRVSFHTCVCVWMYVCVCERAFECLLCARSTRCVSLCVAYVRDAIFGSKKAITRIIRTFCESSLFRGQVI